MSHHIESLKSSLIPKTIRNHTKMRLAKKLFALAALANLASSVMGQEVGIGVSFLDNSGTVFLPISVTPSFRVEPYVGFFRSSNSGDTSTESTSSSSSNATLGAGLFAMGRAADNVQLYGGSRVGYVRRKQTYSYSSTVSPSSDRVQKTSGFLVAPTIGFEYFLQKNISIGAEVAIAYLRTSGHDDYYSITESDTKESTTTTLTSMTIRYYWN